MIGEKIKKYRIRKGLTQSELGDAIGVSNTAIMRYEKGKREPNQEIVWKLKTILGVTEIELRGLTYEISNVSEDEIEPHPFEEFMDMKMSKERVEKFMNSEINFSAGRITNTKGE